MTRFEARTQRPVIGSKEAVTNLSTPKPVGFNGSSPEAGIKKGTVVPVFKNLGELVVTSLPTTKDSFNGDVNMGTKTCENTCAGSCGRSCGCTNDGQACSKGGCY